MSQNLVITNLTTSPVDLSVGQVPASGTLEVTVSDAIPADITSAEDSGVISVVATPVLSAAKVKKVIATAGTNNALVQAGSSTLLSMVLGNTTTAVLYAHFYNKATAPTAGTDVPVFTLPVPASGVLDPVFPSGVELFPNGLGLSLSGAPADTDATTVAAGSIVGAVFYE